jgi:hypothetical protein
MGFYANHMLHQIVDGGGDGDGNENGNKRTQGGPTQEAADNLQLASASLAIDMIVHSTANNQYYTHMGTGQRMSYVYERHGTANAYPGYRTAVRVSSGVKWGWRIVGIKGVYDQYVKCQEGKISSGQLIIEGGII